MTRANQLPGVALAAAMLAGMVWASNASITVHTSADAMLRLAWSVLPERVEVCREPDANEQARLPQHMRQRLVCEGDAASYRLTVRADGRTLADQIVRAGGMRRDRRLYVFHEAPLPVGERAIDLRFDRIDRAGTPSPLLPSGPGVSTVPPHLAFVQRVTVRSREVVIITYDPERRALVAK